MPTVKFNNKVITSKFVSPQQPEGVTSDDAKTVIVVTEDGTQMAINGGIESLNRQITATDNQLAALNLRKAELTALRDYIVS